MRRWSPNRSYSRARYASSLCVVVIRIAFDDDADRFVCAGRTSSTDSSCVTHTQTRVTTIALRGAAACEHERVRGATWRHRSGPGTDVDDVDVVARCAVDRRRPLFVRADFLFVVSVPEREPRRRQRVSRFCFLIHRPADIDFEKLIVMRRST